MCEDSKLVYMAYKVKVEAIVLSPLCKAVLEDVVTIKKDVEQLRYALKATTHGDQVISLLGLKGDVDDNSDLLLDSDMFMITDDCVINKSVEEI